MDIIKYILVYLSGFITILILDSIWLGYVTKDFIIREFHTMISLRPDGGIQFHLGVGIMAWFIISAMIVTFVTLRSSSSSEALIYGALLGCMSYAMYDLTNLTFLTGYSLRFTIVDMLWGTFVGASVALSSYTILTLLS